MSGLGFVSKLLPGSRRRKLTSVRKPTRSRLELEPLEERALLSGNVLQTTLVSDLTQIANTAAAYERALSASANSLVSNLTQSSNTAAAGFGTVLQTNLVSDLPGVAQVLDPNLVNPWGISESASSPFWISDKNAGVASLYNVPGANN